MIEQYLEAKRIGSRYTGNAGSPKTIKAYRAGLSAAQRLVGKDLLDFTEDDADRLMYLMGDYANSYKANILSALRGFYTWALRTGRYQGSHPFDAISTPKAKRQLPTILTREQIDCLLASIPTKKYRLFFELMYFGGLRIGEVANLRREDIANDGTIIRGKGDKQRYVYLPASLRKKLNRWMEKHSDSPYVFYGVTHNATVDKPMTLVQAYEEFDEAKRLCGLNPQLRPHNLRHSAATHMHAATGDLALTQKFLGHARPETTVIYAQIADSRMHDVQKSVFGD